MQSESHTQSQILNWLRNHNVLHWRIPVGGVKHAGIRKKSPMRGFPDLMGCIPGTLGRMFAIEIKADDGNLSQCQKDVIFNLEKAGALVIVARSLQDVTIIFKEFIAI